MIIKMQMMIIVSLQRIISYVGLLALSSIAFSVSITHAADPAQFGFKSYRPIDSTIIPIHIFNKMWKYLDILDTYEFLQSHSGTYRYNMVLSKFFRENPAIEDNFIKQYNAYRKLFIFFYFLFADIR